MRRLSVAGCVSAGRVPVLEPEDLGGLSTSQLTGKPVIMLRSMHLSFRMPAEAPTCIEASLQQRPRSAITSRGVRAGGTPAELRKQLRSGAFSGVRENIRAVGEWAAAGQPGDKQQATQLVSAVFTTLQASCLACRRAYPLASVCMRATQATSCGRRSWLQPCLLHSRRCAPALPMHLGACLSKKLRCAK